MGDNRIGDIGAFALADAISQSRSLKTIKLDENNEISAKGVAAIAEATKHNMVEMILYS